MKILHVGVHENANRNSGDTVLFEMVRQAFNSLGDNNFEWDKRQVWQAVSENDVRHINNEYDAIIIGGGGLLLKDQKGADASASGWQWNCSLTALKSISVPIIVFAIGYNRFRDQDDFLSVFDEHINTLISQSIFFSVRNHGSIEKLKTHVAPNLISKIKKQSCPTTIISCLNSNWSNKQNPKVRRVAINAAFDRIELRLGNTKEPSLKKFNSIINLLKEENYDPVIVAHKQDDLQIIEFLDKHNQNIEIFNLTDMAFNDVIDFYTSVCLSIGMRGHSQMIPLGMRIPIFSIITHDKMRYLLEDINQPEWGAELSSDSFIDVFDTYLKNLNNNKSQVEDDIDIIVNSLFHETDNNIKTAVRSIK